MKKLRVNMILVFVGLFAISCAYNASMVKTSYNVLAVSQATYDTAMKTLADLDKRGMISVDDKVKAMEVASIYYKTHNAAVEALAKYEETRSSTDQQRLEEQIALVGEAIANLLTIIKPYIGG